MPFVYRLQKILDFRVRKKEEQLLVVQKAQQALFMAQEDIRKNNEEIVAIKTALRTADFRMMETYDKYLHHLWEKGAQLEEIKIQKEKILQDEMQKLIELEQAVKVLDKHKEKSKEAYLAEEKNAEMKQMSELGVQRYFQHDRDLKEEEEALLKQFEQQGGFNES